MTAPAVKHPTPAEAAARTNVHERLMAAIPHECQWKGDVCLTRVRLFRRATEWSVELSKVGGASARIKRIAEERYRRALEDHAAHHCEPAPIATPECICNGAAGFSKVDGALARLCPAHGRPADPPTNSQAVEALDAYVDRACEAFRKWMNARTNDGVLWSPETLAAYEAEYVECRREIRLWAADNLPKPFTERLKETE